MMHSASACITGASRHTGVPDHRWTCALNREFAKAHTLRMAAVPLQLAGGLQAPQGFDLGCVSAQQACRRGRHRRNSSSPGSTPKPVKHRHSGAMGAGHLNDEGALNLIPGLGAFDERQAGIHSYLGDSTVRQPCRCN